MIIGIDAGGFGVKVWGPKGPMFFPSTFGESRELRGGDGYAPDDIHYVFGGKEGFAGELANRESKFRGSRKGNTKNHEEAKLRILIAIHRYCLDAPKVRIIVGQPIGMHNKNEKSGIKALIEGTHLLTINGKEKEIKVLQAEVAAECAAAYWIDPTDGVIRIVDVGSGTINGATLKDGRYNDLASFTVDEGLSEDDTAYANIADEIFRQGDERKWKRNDTVRVIGGAAETMLPYIQERFPEAKISAPKYKNKLESATFANAFGFFEIAQKVYLENE